MRKNYYPICVCGCCQKVVPGGENPENGPCLCGCYDHYFVTPDVGAVGIWFEEKNGPGDDKTFMF